MQDGLCPEQQFEALLGCVPVERFAGALTPLVSDGIQVCFAEGPTTRAFGHVIDAVTVPITSNRPTTHVYTTMRDATLPGRDNQHLVPVLLDRKPRILFQVDGQLDRNGN